MASFGAHAGEVEDAKIRFSGGTYTYRFEVTVDAPIDAVREVVTDYDNLGKINDDVIESSVVEHYDSTTLKRRLWLEHCLLAFCFDLYFVEKVEHITPDHIVTTVIPEESNFKHGISIWRLSSPTPDRTSISVEAEQKPDFWIPPVIGPLIMRRAFKKEVRETAAHIEREAQAN